MNSIGKRIETLLNTGEIEEAWHSLKGWYRAAEDRAPKPCYESMDKQMRERVEDVHQGTPTIEEYSS